MEAFFIYQLIIITRAGYIEIGWKLVRSAQFFTQNPNLASEWLKSAFSKIEKIVAWVITVKQFCYFLLFSILLLLFSAISNKKGFHQFPIKQVKSKDQRVHETQVTELVKMIFADQCSDVHVGSSPPSSLFCHCNNVYHTVEGQIIARFG